MNNSVCYLFISLQSPLLPTVSLTLRLHISHLYPTASLPCVSYLEPIGSYESGLDAFSVPLSSTMLCVHEIDLTVQSKEIIVLNVVDSHKEW